MVNTKVCGGMVGRSGSGGGASRSAFGAAGTLAARLVTGLVSGLVGGVVAGLVVGLVVDPATAQRVNVGLYQEAFATNSFDTFRGEFATDGKVGPGNRWQSTTRGLVRLDVTFPEPVTIGSMHLYTGTYGGSPNSSVDLEYLDGSGTMVPVPGGAVSGNTATAANVVFASPVTTTELHVFVNDRPAAIEEIALFPPNGGAGYPLGTDVNLNQMRQHRVAFTTASSTAGGTSRRAVIDGYVNSTGLWRSNASGPHTFTLDISDPPETNPPRVRTVTTPVTIGSVHVYSGDGSGSGVVSSGHFEWFDPTGGTWQDVPGGGFSGNASDAFEVVFGGAVTTARLRMVIDDTQQVALRELVPLPPRDGMGWPIGTSVVVAEKPSYLEYGDMYYSLALAGEGIAATSEGSGGVALTGDVGGNTQQYQVLLNVGTDHYRIRNRVTGMCLQVEGASTAAGAAVIEGVYSALPHQQWRRSESGGVVRFTNALSGLALAAANPLAGGGLEQAVINTRSGAQAWELIERAPFPKKGQGGQPQVAADAAKPEWAYNWGQGNSFEGAPIQHWPMQWGSFSWDSWPYRMPSWQRNAEPVVLMGYNEPDGAEQSDIPVDVGIEMWPRLEAQNLPLLAPAPVNPTNSWITAFMDGVQQKEMRVEFAAVHSYGGDNADSFINKLSDTRNAFGYDICVTEFSVVDWNNNNTWDDDDVYRFFAEVFWRMELLPWVKRHAIFYFADDPTNPISDNRGEMVRDLLPGEETEFVWDLTLQKVFRPNMTLTAEGKLFSAWDGDAVVRSDTQYHVHNEGRLDRFGVVDGVISRGDRKNDGDGFRWVLVPYGQTGRYHLVSYADGRVLAFGADGPELRDAAAAGDAWAFQLIEAEHGWFYLQTPGGQRMRSTGSGFELVGSGTTALDARWRFIRAFDDVPGTPRGVEAVQVDGPEVAVSWEPHGFRDLFGFSVFRAVEGTDFWELVAENVQGTAFTDTVPAVGSYEYAVSAVGDTGESALGIGAPVAVETCAGDFNLDFVYTPDDVVGIIAAVEGGFDYNGDLVADVFDLLDYAADLAAGCNAP